MSYAATTLVTLGMALGFWRLVTGPSAQDRLNATAVVGSGVTIWVLIYIFQTNCVMAADVVLLYSILGFASAAIFSFHLRRGD